MNKYLEDQYKEAMRRAECADFEFQYNGDLKAYPYERLYKLNFRNGNARLKVTVFRSSLIGHDANDEINLYMSPVKIALLGVHRTNKIVLYGYILDKYADMKKLHTLSDVTTNVYLINYLDLFNYLRVYCIFNYLYDYFLDFNNLISCINPMLHRFSETVKNIPVDDDLKKIFKLPPAPEFVLLSPTDISLISKLEYDASNRDEFVSQAREILGCF
jgi:hypothetical protein